MSNIMKKKIGIIGGAGPMASCLLYQEIIRICQKSYSCQNDQDFPEIVIINYPFSNMLCMEDVQQNKALLINELQECFNRLEQQKIDIAVIACNTLHTFLRDITTNIKILIEVDNVIAQYMKQQKLKKIAVFSTETTIALGLYQKRCGANSIMYTNEQTKLTQVINNILAGTVSGYEIDTFCTIIENLYQKSLFDGIVLGCTELSLIYEPVVQFLQKRFSNVTLIDTTRLLAQTVVQASFI